MTAPRLHWRPQEWSRRIEPAALGLEYTSAERLALSGAIRLEAGPEEVCLACLEGTFRYEAAGRSGEAARRDMLYLPPGSAAELAAEGAVIARFGAPCDLAAGFAHLRFAEIDRDPARHKVYGKVENNSRRDVWNFIDDGFAAGRLLTGICAGSPGGWTAWPPHEHGAKREEVYAYFEMGEAFGVQLVYETMDSPLAAALVRDGDLVSVPGGYHPSVGCPAGRISYVYCMVAKRQGERSFLDLRIQPAYGDRFEQTERQGVIFGMKVAQSSAVYFHYSLEYAIRELHALGYDGIEIWGGRPHMYRHDLDDRLAGIGALLNDLGMKVCNFIPAQFRYPSVLCSENETVRRDSVAYIKTAMDNAVRVGSPSVSLCPGIALFDRDAAAGWRQLRRSLEEIDEYGAALGLRLLIEPAHRFESNLILTVADALRMIDELRSDRFGVLLDTGHAHLNGESLGEAVKSCRGLPLHIHLDDNRGDADAHLIPGRGAIDFAPLFAALSETGYEGFVAVELGTGYIMAAACRESLEFLRGR